MKKKKILPLLYISLLFSCCADDSSTSGELEYYHYDTNLSYDENVLSLDSISDCLTNSETIKAFAENDSAFIETKNEKTYLTFQSYIYYSQSNIKSVGTYSFNDTLKLALIEKKKTPEVDLFCPVMVYTTLKKKIESKYISTASGVYFLGRK